MIISAALMFEVARAPAAMAVELFKINGPIRNTKPTVSITDADGNHLAEIEF